MEFVALTIRVFGPRQIAFDFAEILVSRKLRLKAFQRRKNRQNPVRSDGVNDRREVACNFVLKKWCFVQLFPEKYFGNFLFFFLETQMYYFFARRKTNYFSVFFAQNETFPFFLAKYSFIKNVGKGSSIFGLHLSFRLLAAAG